MPNSCPCITTIVGPQLDIASSTLRQRLMAGQPVRYQLPDSILAYIQEHNLYVPIPSVPAE
jgi:nicotinate-nucleotide adenylyltransferase